MSDQPSTPKTIFLNALEVPSPEARQAYVVEHCGGDPALAAEVNALLQHHQELGSFLQPPDAHPTASIDTPLLIEVAGTMIGPYKLLEQIGEGGMGVVFMAEQQEPVRRKVAVKLIKPGMDTRQVIARFEAERQALAVMDHPSIARVLDGGTTPSGHPYFVMELVRGVPITTYCDENNLPVRERLELFASLCQAIQHAHTKGIIHRDIKPTNVLVTRQDGRPVVKVIDFGVAKAMGQQLTEKTLFTNFAQLIGTPLYMSPEQAEQSGVDIDTRSDIYSLGVLLYELLTGSTPVDAEQLKQAAFDEIRRIIREDEPPTPSARISGSHTLPAIAAHRHTEPARLSKLVRGELDWIVMKALEKHRNRRYETANSFAADLLHYLNDEPVLACPPSARYRLGKFARRHRVAITTATLVATALVLGTIVSTWQAIRAETARAAEAEQRQIAEAARTAEAEQRKVAEAARTAEATQRQAAEAQRSEAEKHQAAAEANYQKAKAAVDKYFTLVSESKLFEVPGLQPLRKDLLESALEFYEGAALERTSDPVVLIDVAATHLRVSSIYLALDRADDFIAAIRRGLDVIDQLHRDHPGATDHEQKLAGFWKGTRWTQAGMAPPRDALGAFQTMFRFEKTWQQFIENHPSEVRFQSDLAYVQGVIGSGFTTIGRITEGTKYFRKALATSEKVVNQSPQDPGYRSGLAEILQLLARNLKLEGQRGNEQLEFTRRAMQLREALVVEFPDNPGYRSELAGSLKASGELTAKDEPQAARASLQRAVELSESLLQEFPDHFPYMHLWSSALSQLASLHHSTDGASQLEAMTQEVADAMTAQIRLRPKDWRMRQELAFYFCEVAKQARFMDLAERLHRRAQESLESLILDFPDQPDTWKYLSRERLGHNSRYLGWIAQGTGRSDQALQYFDAAVDAFQKLADADIPQRDGIYRDFVSDTLLQKSKILADAGRNDDAVQSARRAVEIYESLEREFPTTAAIRQKSARAVHDLAGRITTGGDYSKADEILRQAIDSYGERAATHPSVPDYPRLRAACQRQLAQVQAAANLEEKAASTYREAITSYQKLITDFPQNADLWRVYHGLAMSFDAIHQPSDAEAAYSKVVELAPGNAKTLNSLAWQYATAVERDSRDTRLAVEFAKKAIKIDPENPVLTSTLGVAHYSAGNWQDAIDTLMKSLDLDHGDEGQDWLFLAMAHWQLGNKVEARRWHAKAVEWMDAHGSDTFTLPRLLKVADELIKNETNTPDQESGEKEESTPSP